MMSSPRDWLSASVVTMTSAPSLADASIPAWKASASPLVAGGCARDLEVARAPLVGVEADDVFDAVLAGDASGAVRRAVVDDQPLDSVEPWHVAGERRIRQR